MANAPFGFLFSRKKGTNLYASGRLPNTFPIAALCWMGDRGIQPRFVETQIGNRPEFEITMKDASAVFDGRAPSSIRFTFEKKFDEFSKLQSNLSTKATKCDTVACDPIFENMQIKALENKITVLPDSSTKKLKEDEWGSEIVIRPNTLANSAMQLFLNMTDDAKGRLRAMSRDLGINNIRDWRSEAEVGRHYSSIDAFALATLREGVPTQKAYTLQALWATDSSPYIFSANPCDLIIWTDVSLLSAAYRESDPSSGDTKDSIGRARRAIVRFVAMFDDLIFKDFINYDTIYRDIAFTNQTDKELSINGSRLRQLIGSDAFRNRRITEENLDEILGGDAPYNITPERRFDACYLISKLLRELNLSAEQKVIARKFLWRGTLQD